MSSSAECSSILFNTCFASGQYKYSIFVPLLIFTILLGSLLLMRSGVSEGSLSSLKSDGDSRTMRILLAATLSSVGLLFPLIIFVEPINFLVASGLFFYGIFFIYKKVSLNPSVLNKLDTYLRNDLRKFNGSSKPAVVAAPIAETDMSIPTNKSFFEEFIMNKATLFFLALLAFGLGLVVFM